MSINILPFKISALAFVEIDKIIKNKQISNDLGLRIGIKGTGCAGISYLIGFDKVDVNDKVFKLDGLTILIQKKHLLYVSGIKIDFIDNNQQRGFTFDNTL
jgi:iron-sulfur cluster assembly protein